MTGAFNEVLSYFDKGGFVMYPLGGGTLVLWYFLGFRFLTLQRGSLRSVQKLINRVVEGKAKPTRGIVDWTVAVCVKAAQTNMHITHLRDVLDDACGPISTELNKGRSIIRSIVTVAPLAGLLGTVIGMIETFDSLAEMALFSQSGGIAGGISQALFTTQMGLAVAVPGLVLGRILDRKQAILEDEIERIKDMLCATSRHPGPQNSLFPPAAAAPAGASSHA